ncbi:hypothetical protein ACFOLJ_12950 [Rugamonas sp. CCM 8940]|uniref:hypothetical protein n=1 Tax=Rugamonas sp. CCM 8940 TaxID=2765359 RepID=UPI0018F668D1|nr:hypothetical protein [Rugamonas sp. CCM 8940]MBJ7308902.1 hypothetical protein [Rugamonas sp. CCM 8940]
MTALINPPAGSPATPPAKPAAQPPAEAGADGPAWRRLQQWQRDGKELAFVYSRSLGGLTQTGRGRLARLSAEALTIEAGLCKLFVVLNGAGYEAGPQQFFTPDLLARFNVEGVAVRLANHDWLFLSAEAVPAHLTIGNS